MNVQSCGILTLESNNEEGHAKSLLYRTPVASIVKCQPPASGRTAKRCPSLKPMFPAAVDHSGPLRRTNPPSDWQKQMSIDLVHLSRRGGDILGFAGRGDRKAKCWSRSHGMPLGMRVFVRFASGGWKQLAAEHDTIPKSRCYGQVHRSKSKQVDLSK